MYDDKPVQKGVGRFGPYLKWNDMFINVNKKYNFNALSDEDIVELIEDKIQKEKEKLLVEWKDEGIKIEKARWGRFKLSQGKVNVELPKETEVEKITLEEALKLIEGAKPKKKATRKKTTSKTKKKK